MTPAERAVEVVCKIWIIGLGLISVAIWFIR